MKTNNDDRRHPPVDIEVLAPGEYAGYRIGPAELETIAKNFARLKGRHDVPVAVRLGHNDEQPLGASDGQPAFGWAERVYTAGGKLYASIVGMPRALRDAVNRRAYRKVSASLYPRWEATEAEKNLRSGVHGPVLEHIAYLGVDQPRIRALADLPRVLARETREHVIACTSDASGVLHAGEVTPMDLKKRGMNTRSLADRIAALERGVDRLRVRSVSVSERLREMRAPAPVTCAALSPQDADADDALAEAFLAEVESVIQRRGWDRTDVNRRREAVRDVLVAWRSEPPTPSAPDAPSLADQLPGTLVESVVKATHVGDRLGAGVASPGGAWMSPTAGPPPTTTRTRPVMAKENGMNEDAPSMYGSDAGEVARLGGERNFIRLREIARARGYDLRSGRDRRVAEAVMFAEAGCGLLQARSYEEAWHAALRRLGVRPERIAFSEAAVQREAAKLVLRERPELITSYGSRGADTANADEIRFAEAIAREIRERGLDPLDPADRREAARRAAKKDPSLAPSYGSGGGRTGMDEEG